MAPDLKKLKNKLMEEKARVEHELMGTSVHTDPARPEDTDAAYTAPVDLADNKDEVEPDELDVAENLEQYEENWQMNATLETRLRDVNRALEKMEAGTYGVCDVCDEAIDEKRLEANPAAVTCIAHAR